MAAASPAQRAQVGRHLQRVHGGRLGPLALRRAVRQCFESYGRYWAESFRVSELSAAEIDAAMSYEGIGHVEAGLAAGRGVILALPHLGAWDFAGAWLGRCRGIPVTAVVEPLEPPELFEWFAEMRRTLRMTIVPLGPDAGSAVLSALHANRVVALLCDRDLVGTGVEVDFFGERTTLPAGPVTLGIRTGAPVLPTAVYFEGSRHRAVVRPPLALEREGTLRQDVARLTQQLARELESLIRRAPEQWHLFQPNWPSDRQPFH